ncbi:MAG: recombinase RecT [Candidatus Adiutrix sp.]|jgi:hypothetical protein|nr:recombinase RecT [Candidatus Adiutrix sp.]
MSVATTSLTELKHNAAPPVKPGDDATDLGFYSGASFSLAMRVGTMFSQSTLVPKHYQGNPANCLIALNMAKRLGADPLMAMQNLHIINGNPGWSSQFLIASFNMCGRFSSIHYKWVGTEGQDDYGCQAWAVEKATNDTLEGSPVTIAIAKKEGWFQRTGSKWQTMPKQMLMYRAAAWLVRAYAPEIAMGLHTAEEMLDMRPGPGGVYESAGAATITTGEIQGRVIEAQPVAEEEAAAISPATLQAIEVELTRLGTPGHLPPELAEKFETGDPGELTEAQGRKAAARLNKL